jgi:Fe-S cluster assembly ATPase SufC
MKIDSIASCCTAKILSYFQEAEGVGLEFQYPGQDIGTTKEALLNKMLEQKLAGQAMFIAFTNDAQKDANKLLKEVGFKSTKWATKTQHANTRLKLWWYSLDQLEA